MADERLDDIYTQSRLEAQAEASPTLRFLKQFPEPTEVAPAKEGEGAPAAAEAPTAPDPSLFSNLFQDVVGGVFEMPKQVLGGIRDAVVEAGKALNEAGDWMRSHGVLTQLPGGRSTIKISVPEVKEGETVTAGVTRSAAQFLTGFVPFFKATKAVGIGGAVVRGAAAGAAADVTVFDPHAPRISNLLNELAPALKTPVTEFLASSPEDTAAEGRLKNALEGLALGGLAEGIFRAASALRKARMAKAAEGRLTGAEKKARRVRPRGELTPQEREFADMGKRYEAAVEEQRRGTRTHELANREATDLGWTRDDLEILMPGTAVNDAEAVAIVRLLKESGDTVKQLAEEAAEGDPDTVRRFLEALYRHGQVDPKRLGAMAEAGRTLSVLNEPISGMNRFLEQFEELFRQAHRGMSPDRLVQMVREFKYPEQLAVFARQLAKPGFHDMVVEAWINGLLSGPMTHARNFTSNTFMTVWAPVERLAAARPREALAMIHGVVESVGDGLRVAARAFQTGQVQSGMTKLEIRPRAISAETLELTGTVGRAIDLIGAAIRTPGRFLIAADELFKAINFRAELRAAAFREAQTEMTVRGATSRRQMAMVYHQVLADPPLAVRQAAEKFALYQTFQQELGAGGQALMAFRESHPIGRFIVPFLKTPINLGKGAVSRTPAGFVLHDVREAIARGGVDRDLALARMSLGSFMMALGAAASWAGYITGGGPKDADQRLPLTDLGWQPYSIFLNGKYVSFNWLEPPGLLLGFAADAATILWNAQLDEFEEGEMTKALGTAAVKGVMTKTWLRGPAEALNALTDPERYTERYMQNLLGSVVPVGVAQIARLQDPVIRDARTTLEAMKARTPFLSDSVRPRRTFFGEPRIREGSLGPDWLSPAFISTKQDDAIAQELVDQGFRIPSPPRRIEGIELPPDMWDRWMVLARKEVKIAGATLHDRLEHVMGTPLYQRQSDGPGGGKEAMVAAYVQQYEELARRQLYQEFPELRAAAEKAHTERVIRRAPTATQGRLTESLGR